MIKSLMVKIEAIGMANQFVAPYRGQVYYDNKILFTVESPSEEGCAQVIAGWLSQPIRYMESNE